MVENLLHIDQSFFELFWHMYIVEVRTDVYGSVTRVSQCSKRYCWILKGKEYFLIDCFPFVEHRNYSMFHRRQWNLHASTWLGTVDMHWHILFWLGINTPTQNEILKSWSSYTLSIRSVYSCFMLFAMMCCRWFTIFACGTVVKFIWVKFSMSMPIIEAKRCNKSGWGWEEKVQC